MSDLGVLTLAVSILWLLLMLAHTADDLLGAYVRGHKLAIGTAAFRLLVSTLLSVAFTPLLVYLLRIVAVGERLRVAYGVYFLLVVLLVATSRTVLGDVAGSVINNRPMTWPHLKRSLLLTTHTHALYATMAGALILLYDFARAGLQRERLHAALAASQLQQLRAQLRPHFLLNTLNTIATLVHRDPKTADSVVTSLGTLLRRTLDLDDVPEITLDEELAFVRHYLAIQQTRFGERLRVDIEAGSETLRCAVLPLVLQPLVENAILHGIANDAGGGRLRITSALDGDALVVQVRDSGLADPAAIRRGVGLRNVEARLDAMYGTRGSLRFHREREEFVAEVRMPARKAAR